MAPGFYGADTAQIRSLSKSLEQSGARLRSVENTVNSMVQSAAWRGPDGDKFRNDWTSTLRPLLNKSSAALQDQSRALLGEADEQERASVDAGSAGGGGNTDGGATPVPANNGQGSSRNWDDAFTDPGYEPAPSGVEWLLGKFGANDGGRASDISEALVLAADKFSWNLDLANVQAGVSKFFDAMKIAGKGLTVLGGFLGVLDIASGIENRDPFRVADGVVGGGLAVAAGVAAATGVGLPVAAAIGAAGLVWGFASMVSGDVPVTKRIWDFGAGVVGGVRDLASGAADVVGWVGGKLGFG